MYKLSKAQQTALHKVYARQPELNSAGRSYLQFRRTARPMSHMDCVMVPFCNMWLGIEPDGYTHS